MPVAGRFPPGIICYDDMSVRDQSGRSLSEGCEDMVLPTIQHTVAVFETSGFTLAQHRRIQQETACSLSEFAKRARSRADSALMLISDSEFQEGQTAIEAAAAVEPRPVPVVEVIELLALRNGSGRSAA